MNTLTAVVDVLAKVTDRQPATFTEDTAFDSVGLDSLAMLEVALAIEKDLGVSVDEGQVAETRTVGELVELVQSSPAVR